MPEGISPNSLNPLSQVYLDSIAEGRLKSLEKASFLSASDDPDDQDEARKIRVRHDYESLKKQIGKKKKPQKSAVDESVDFSHWRDDLREIVGGASPILSSNPAVSSEPNTGIHATDTQTAKKVTEKKVKNKIKINPEFKEAVEEIGGQLLEVKEVENNGDDEQPVDSEDAKQKKMQKDKETMLKKRIIRMKLRAVNQTGGEDIVAGYEPEGEIIESRLKKVDECWKTHKQQGYKKKGGKMVPNCVPKNEEVQLEATRYAKETGKSFKSNKPVVKGGTAKDDKAFQAVSKKYSGQMMGGQQKKKVRGQKPDESNTPFKRAAARVKQIKTDNKALASMAKKAGYKSTQDYVDVQAVRKGGLGT